jgi:hypothetical protein
MATALDDPPKTIFTPPVIDGVGHILYRCFHVGSGIIKPELNLFSQYAPGFINLDAGQLRRPPLVQTLRNIGSGFRIVECYPNRILTCNGIGKRKNPQKQCEGSNSDSIDSIDGFHFQLPFRSSIRGVLHTDIECGGLDPPMSFKG